MTMPQIDLFVKREDPVCCLLAASITVMGRRLDGVKRAKMALDPGDAVQTIRDRPSKPIFNTASRPSRLGETPVNACFRRTPSKPEIQNEKLARRAEMAVKSRAGAAH